MFKFIQKQLKSKKGFTLVELVVVIAILGILGAIAVPQFTNVQKDAKIKADEVSIEIVKKAAELYVISENIGEGSIDPETLVTKGYLEAIPSSQSDTSNNTVTITVDEDGKVKVDWEKSGS